MSERAISIDLQRHKDGIKVGVQVSSDVEAFFRKWGGGVTEAPSRGRLWKAIGDGKLSVWSYDIPTQSFDDSYSLFHTGSGLYIDTGGVNISFIRMVGATEGKEFIIDSVMSREELEKVGRQLSRAADRFYSEYLQPVHLNIFVGVKDVGRDSFL